MNQWYVYVSLLTPTSGRKIRGFLKTEGWKTELCSIWSASDLLPELAHNFISKTTANCTIREYKKVFSSHFPPPVKKKNTPELIIFSPGDIQQDFLETLSLYASTSCLNQVTSFLRWRTAGAQATSQKESLPRTLLRGAELLESSARSGGDETLTQTLLRQKFFGFFFLSSYKTNPGSRFIGQPDRVVLWDPDVTSEIKTGTQRRCAAMLPARRLFFTFVLVFFFFINKVPP